MCRLPHIAPRVQHVVFWYGKTAVFSLLHTRPKASSEGSISTKLVASLRKSLSTVSSSDSHTTQATLEFGLPNVSTIWVHNDARQLGEVLKTYVLETMPLVHASMRASMESLRNLRLDIPLEFIRCFAPLPRFSRLELLELWTKSTRTLMSSFQLQDILEETLNTIIIPFVNNHSTHLQTLDVMYSFSTFDISKFLAKLEPLPNLKVLAFNITSVQDPHVIGDFLTKHGSTLRSLYMCLPTSLNTIASLVLPPGLQLQKVTLDFEFELPQPIGSTVKPFITHFAMSTVTTFSFKHILRTMSTLCNLLDCLKSCQNLQKLDIYVNRLSMDGVSKIQEAFPRLQELSLLFNVFHIGESEVKIPKQVSVIIFWPPSSDLP